MINIVPYSIVYQHEYIIKEKMIYFEGVVAKTQF